MPRFASDPAPAMATSGKVSPDERANARFKRKKLVQCLAQSLFDVFIRDDNGHRLSCSGCLVHSSSLRKRKTRDEFDKLFRTVYRFEDIAVSRERLWTKAVLRDSVSELVKILDQEGITIPTFPGFTIVQWVKEQGTTLHRLAQQARKNAWLKAHIMASKGSAMDNAETQMVEYFED